MLKQERISREATVPQARVDLTDSKTIELSVQELQVILGGATKTVCVWREGMAICSEVSRP